MYIIEVIPLTNLPHNAPQLLSYFFSSHLEKGAIVEGMIGNRKIKAVVISSTPLEQQKSSLKKSTFQLKSLSKVIFPEPRVSDIQLKTALWISKYYYVPLGLSLKTVLTNSLKKEEEIYFAKGKEIEAKPGILIIPAKRIINRIAQYVKDSEGQVLTIVPDKTVFESFSAELRPKFDETKLIIGTRSALFSKFKNLKLIIVEDPLNEAYKSDMTPKYNTPDLAEKIAQLYGAEIVFISPTPGVKHFIKIQNNQHTLLCESKTSNPDIKIIDTINEIRMGNFDLLSRYLNENILKTIRDGKNVLIFSPRRGFAGLLICQNCGWNVKCPNCSTPLKVHKSADLILKCHRCAHWQPFPKFCQNCNSYKLKTSGPAGTQKVYDKIRELLDQNNLKVPILVMDSDVAKNATEEEEIMEEIKKPKPSVLIATQMIFSYRHDLNFSLVGVMNADSLITIPDYNVEEKLLYQLKKLTDFNPSKLIIQTYNPDNEVLKCLETNYYEPFYNKEIEMRKLLGYPPFCRLIKLTYKNKDQKKAFISARALVEKFRMAISQLQLGDKIQVSDCTPGFIEKEKGLYNYHIIIKSPAEETPREILKFVPAGWSIDVDPKSTL